MWIGPDRRGGSLGCDKMISGELTGVGGGLDLLGRGMRMSTFSIAAYGPVMGELGVEVQSKLLAEGLSPVRCTSGSTENLEEHLRDGGKSDLRSLRYVEEILKERK